MVIDKVAKLSPTARWLYWIKEREAIRGKRALNLPKPWTDDVILQSYRFCNVRRMDDAVSRWLLKNWYIPFKNHGHMLPAVALARFINRPESLEEITHLVFNPIKGGSWTKDRLRQTEIVTSLRNYRDVGNTVFNGAYMVRGNDGIDKIDCVVNHYVAPLVDLPYESSSMEETWNAVLPSYGMGSFMAGQIVADLRHAVSGAWSDKYDWAPMGPGSKRGLNRIFERRLDYPLKQDQFLDELRQLILTGKHELSQDIVKRLEAIDWQNTLCEFDKYCRALLGEGKPKQKYQGA